MKRVCVYPCMLAGGAGNKDFQSYFSKYYESYTKDNKKIKKKFKNPEKDLFEPEEGTTRRPDNCLGSNCLGNLHCVEVSL